jgi:hypothetical protein
VILLIANEVLLSINLTLGRLARQRSRGCNLQLAGAFT